MSIDEVLACVDTCLDCFPDASASSHTDNKLCEGGVCPDGIALTPYLRVSGAVVDLVTEVYSHKRTMPSSAGYDYIKARFEPPYAIHIWARPVSSRQ